MKSEKIENKDFNINLTLSKKEAKALMDIINDYYTENDFADSLLIELKQYFVNENETVKEIKEKEPIITFDYINKKGESSNRRLKVQRIFRKNNNIYFSGIDTKIDERRTFSWERMSSIRLNDIIYDNGFNSLIVSLIRINPDIVTDSLSYVIF